MERKMTTEETDDDKRFTLTEWERESVIRLKGACDEQKIHYKSLFELVKFILVSRSAAPDKDKNADEKRLRHALSRIKKLRAFEAEYGLDDVVLSEEEYFKEIDKIAPGLHFWNFLRDNDGRVVVPHNASLLPKTEVTKEDLRLAFVAQLRMLDIAIADVEDARLGIAMVAVTGESNELKIQMGHRYVKTIMKMRPLTQEAMHSYRFQRVYVQAPTIATIIVNMVKRILPSKIASRVKVVSKLSDLDDCLQRCEGQPKTTLEWYQERSLRYEETLERLTL